MRLHAQKASHGWTLVVWCKYIWHNLYGHTPAAMGCCLSGWSWVNSWKSPGWVFCKSNLRRILYLSLFLLIFLTWCSRTFSQWFIWCSSKYCDAWLQSESGGLDMRHCMFWWGTETAELLFGQYGVWQSTKDSKACLWQTNAQSCQAKSLYVRSTCMQCNRGSICPSAAAWSLAASWQAMLIACWNTASNPIQQANLCALICMHCWVTRLMWNRHTCNTAACTHRQAVPQHQTPHCWG